jgi:hypothetical protein
MEMKYEFVEFIPKEIEEGILYISTEYGTAVHSCCCGCKEEIVTPLSPTDWHISFNGETVSLYPSIGSWGLKCRSHYWIKENKVRWAESWPDERVQLNREHDLNNKNSYYKKPEVDEKPTSMWRRIVNIFN